MERILPAPRGGGFRMEGYWVWCGSVIRGPDGTYHLFAARWPKTLPFAKGYVFASEVVRAAADTPEGPYRFVEVVLPDRGAGYWDGRMTHNPTICRWGSGYALFYIGATYAGARPTRAELESGEPARHGQVYRSIRIGLATAEALEGPWRRLDQPILDPRADKWDQVIVTNPAPCVLDDGRVYLYYRSSSPQGWRIGLAGADGPGARFERLHDEPVLNFGGEDFVEDPFVWRRGRRFELIAKDCRGGITGELHAGVGAHSRDGIAWTLNTPPQAYSRRVRWDDGSVTMQGSLERPFLLFDGDTPTHLFAATADGPGGFHGAENTWNMVIPLRRS
ncbi:MAG: glycoside hydrolase family protein [Candidatus Marinimicrobia bacterium]|nr:glycoside hydrolase family protein [Candidatus Neomarinimicrobiota bacterium]